MLSKTKTPTPLFTSVALQFHPFEIAQQGVVEDGGIKRKRFVAEVQVMNANQPLHRPVTSPRSITSFGGRSHKTPAKHLYEARTEFGIPERHHNSKIAVNFCVTLRLPYLNNEESKIYTAVFRVYATQNDMFGSESKLRLVATGSCSYATLCQNLTGESNGAFTLSQEWSIPLELIDKQAATLSSTMGVSGSTRSTASGIQASGTNDLRPMSLVLQRFHGRSDSEHSGSQASLLGTMPQPEGKPSASKESWLDKFANEPGLQTHRCSAFAMPTETYTSNQTTHVAPRTLCCEHIFETELSFRIPSSFLQQQLVQRAETLNQWINLFQQARAVQLRFESVKEAAMYSCVPITVRVNSGLEIAQTHRDTFPDNAREFVADWNATVAKDTRPISPTEQYDRAEVSIDNRDPKPGKRAFFKQQLSKFDNFRSTAKATAQRAAAGDLFHNRETSKLSSPFVKIYFEPPNGEPIRLAGQTNTEYRTANPSFGSNSNRRLCEHAHPRTISVVHLGKGGAAVVGDGKSLRLFTPVTHDVSKFGKLKFVVLHERFSLSRGITQHPMLQASVDLSQLYCEAAHQGKGVVNMDVPLQSLHGGLAENMGTLNVDIAIHCGTFKELQMAGKAGPAPPSQSPLVNWNLEWLKDFVYRMEKDLELLHRSVENCERALNSINNRSSNATSNGNEGWLQGVQREEDGADSSDDGAVGPSGGQLDNICAPVGSLFKSSRLKKDYRVAGIPTNLHVSLFAFETKEDVSETQNSEANLLSFSDDSESEDEMTNIKVLQVYPTVTSGIPAAHCLGLETGTSVTELTDEFNVHMCGVKTGWTPIKPLLSSDLSNMDMNAYQTLAEVDRRLFVRSSLVFSQGLAIFVSSFLTELHVRLSGVGNRANSNVSPKLWGKQLRECGFFFGMESLVSAHGKELTMLRDCMGFINWLQSCKLIICSQSENVPSQSSASRNESCHIPAPMQSSSASSYLGPASAPMQSSSASNSLDPATTPVKSSAANSYLGPASAPVKSSAGSNEQNSEFLHWNSIDSGSIRQPVQSPQVHGGFQNPFNFFSGELEDVLTGSTSSKDEYKEPQISLTQQQSNNTDSSTCPWTITIALHEKDMLAFGFDSAKSHEIAISAVVFTQGINEMQTLANMKNRMSSGKGRNAHSQRDLNLEGVERVKKYASSLLQFLRRNATTKGGKHKREIEYAQLVKGVVTHLNSVMQRQQVHLKDTEILNVAEDTFRVLNGGLVTFCKSGKDRTAMAVTLAQARALLGVPLLGTSQHQVAGGDVIDEQGSWKANPQLNDSLLRVASIFREYGVRLYVAEKNTGRPLYSFNALQRKLLPVLYRPPVSTIQDMITSVVARDS